MSQPDIDPPSVFPLPSSSEQEHSTSEYASSSLSYSISEAPKFATHVPPHHRRDSGYTTLSDAHAGYTTHGEVPSSASSHSHQLNGFAEDEHAVQNDAHFSIVSRCQQAITQQGDITTSSTSLQFPNCARWPANISFDSSVTLAEDHTRGSIPNVLPVATAPVFAKDDGTTRPIL